MRALEVQTLFDIAIQSCGSAEAAFDFAVLNGVSLTDEPVVIDVVPGIVDADIAAYFLNKNIQPATGLVEAAERVVAAANTLVGDYIHIGSYVRVIEYQTLLDIALQETGSIETAYAMAVFNGISLTETIAPGTLLQRVGIVEKKIKNYYVSKNIQPATGMVESVTPPSETGIFDFTFDFTFN